MSKLIVAGAVLVAACAGPAQQTRNPSAPAVRETAAPSPGPLPASEQPAPSSASSASAPLKNQPPHIKLKLGHYRNARLGIGLTIDMTEMTESVADIDPVKIKFDGDSKIWKLDGQHGGGDRIDYVREGGRVMLHAWPDGRKSVYVPDPDTGRASEEIAVYRDADADPL